MKILIAPDKFKGSLTAQQVCHAIGAGLKKANPGLNIVFHPMADGGDGSLEVLSGHLSLKRIEVETVDPLGRTITANYFTSRETAFIELASASGLVLLKEQERNPLFTSTLGTGKMVDDAIGKGFKKIFLFLGGSSTNDAGMGIASALGCDFVDIHANTLKPVGKNLILVNAIRKHLHFDANTVTLTLLCDVTNPLFGPDGAAYVYAPQKGANEENVKFLDKGLQNISKILSRETGSDVASIPGCGAAGGVAASLVPIFSAKLKNGFAAISELTALEQQIKEADIVVTGEGKLDNQSLQGKVVGELAKLCRFYDKAFYIFAGKYELTEKEKLSLGAKGVFVISHRAKDTSDAVLNGAGYLEEMALLLVRNFLIIGDN